jgi:hypothetical protein
MAGAEARPALPAKTLTRLPAEPGRNGNLAAAATAAKSGSKMIDKVNCEPYVEGDKNPGFGGRGSNRDITAAGTGQRGDTEYESA